MRTIEFIPNMKTMTNHPNRIAFMLCVASIVFIGLCAYYSLQPKPAVPWAVVVSDDGYYSFRYPDGAIHREHYTTRGQAHAMMIERQKWCAELDAERNRKFKDAP